HQLLKTYQPVLVFHPQELFRPTEVQTFISDSELERFRGSNPQQLPLDQFRTVIDPDPGPGDLGHLTPGSFYRLDETACEADAPLAGAAWYADTWGGRGGAGGYRRGRRPPSPARRATPTRGADAAARPSTAGWRAPRRGSSSSTGSSITTTRSFFRRRLSAPSGSPTRATGRS